MGAFKEDDITVVGPGARSRWDESREDRSVLTFVSWHLRSRFRDRRNLTGIVCWTRLPCCFLTSCRISKCSYWGAISFYIIVIRSRSHIYGELRLKYRRFLLLWEGPTFRWRKNLTHRLLQTHHAWSLYQRVVSRARRPLNSILSCALRNREPRTPIPPVIKCRVLPRTRRYQSFVRLSVLMCETHSSAAIISTPLLWQVVVSRSRCSQWCLFASYWRWKS